MNKLDVKKIIKEEVKKSLMENKDAKKVVLEGRLIVINEMISLSEADFINKAKQWLKSKAYGAAQGIKDTVKNDVMVNPEKIISNPNSVTKILDSAIKNVQSQITKFRSETLQTSTNISNLQDKVFELFGKFFNLLDSIPQEKRGLYEREVMKVVSVFYNLLMEEKKRIEVYISSLAREASMQGYDMGKSAADMSGYSKASAAPEGQPASGRAAVGGSALIPGTVRESLDLKKKDSNPEEEVSELANSLKSLLGSKLPFSSLKLSGTPGGVMIIIAKLSADDRNAWPEGELQNSRWAQVSVEFNNGVYALRQSYGSLKPTLRSAKVLTPGAVLRKFNDWLSQI